MMRKIGTVGKVCIFCANCSLSGVFLALGCT